MVLNCLRHFELPLNNLKSFGLWQTKKSSTKYNLWTFVCVVICLELNIVLSLVHLLTSDQFDEEVLILCLIYAGPNFKFINLKSKMKLVKSLFSDLKLLLKFAKFEEASKRLELKKHSKFMIRLFRVFLGSIMFSASTDLAMPYFENRLPYKMWIPYNYCGPTLLWLTSILQVVLALITSSIAISIDMIPIFFMGMVTVLLAIFSRQLEMFAESETNNKSYQELVNFVKIHLQIKSFVAKVEKCFSITFLAQGFLSSGFICLTAFQLSTVRQIDLNSFSKSIVFRFHQSISHQVSRAF